MKAIEIFSCSGGMAEGFARAGIPFSWVFDKDPDACESYTANLRHAPVMIDARHLLELVESGWRPVEEIDLLVADPPCTPWSRAGKRLGVEDERDMLGVTCELIRILDPHAYLIGNVPGLQDNTQWHHVQRALEPLRSAGYCIADYAQLDAADYGVPQHRIRPFWFGHRKGPCLTWPEKTHGPPQGSQDALPGFSLKPWVTCREALSHLPLKELGRPVRMRAHKGHLPSNPDEPGKVVTSSMSGNGGAAIELKGHVRHPVNVPDAPSYTVTSKGDGRGAQGACVMRVEDPNRPPADPDEPHRTLGTTHDQALMRVGQGNRVGQPDKPGATVTAKASRVGAGEGHVLSWPWDVPGTTVQADQRMAAPGHHDGSFMSNPNAVVLSEKAAAILQGFPEGWVFAGKTKKTRWSQIGQAMPPPLAEVVARAIARQLDATQPQELGGLDPARPDGARAAGR